MGSKSKFVIAVVFVLAIPIVSSALMMYFFSNWETRGQFGDMFGAVNTIFSGLAFAGLIYAITLQSEELELQRRELESTRHELARSASAQAKSEAALAAQARSLEHSNRLMAIGTMISACDSVILSFEKLRSGVTQRDLEIVNKARGTKAKMIDLLDKEFNTLE